MGAFVIGILNAIIAGLGALLVVICAALPPSPFQALDNSPIAPYLSGLNYFVNVALIIDIGTAWLICVGGFYIYKIVLHWIGAVE
jgi:hypothetical protein